MRNVRIWMGILLLLGMGALLPACGAGNGTVYVGVGVPGAWGPYPPGRYYPPPRYGGRPCCWDDDAQDGDRQDADGQDTAEQDAEFDWDRRPDSFETGSPRPGQDLEWLSRLW